MYQTHNRRRRLTGKQELTRHIVNVVGGLIGTTIIAVFFSFVIINWLSGCGESFIQADGSYIQGECIYPSDLWNDRHPEHTYMEDK